MKSRIFVGIVAFIMLGSTAGYALFSPAQTSGAITAQDRPEQDILLVNERKLLGNEVLAVLGAGRVLIEYSYSEGCAECETDKVTLELFAQKFRNYVILSEFTGDEEKVGMTGKNGDTVRLNGTVTEESLTVLFCSVTQAQPKECILREIGSE